MAATISTPTSCMAWAMRMAESMTATLDSPIGSRDGPTPRRTGAARTRRKDASSTIVTAMLFGQDMWDILGYFGVFFWVSWPGHASTHWQATATIAGFSAIFILLFAFLTAYCKGCESDLGLSLFVGFAFVCVRRWGWCLGGPQARVVTLLHNPWAPSCFTASPSWADGWI